jgi:hypothetical protein
MNKTNKKPFLGLTLKGEWRDCQAMMIAQRGSIVLEESELCPRVGIPQDGLEHLLAEQWREHDAHANRGRHVTEGNILLVRQYMRAISRCECFRLPKN